MKRSLASAVLLFALCATSFARVVIDLPTPQDDPDIRRALRDNPELKPLDAGCQSIIEARFWPLNLDQIAKAFGPELDRPGISRTNRYPADLVLPGFSPLGFVIGGMRNIDPAKNKDHIDLHAVGDIGYIDFYYQLDGEHIQAAAVFFRADDKFVPLKSTADLPRRLEWDKAKFNALKKWLDEHLPVVPGPQGDPALPGDPQVQQLWQWNFTVLARESQAMSQSRLWPLQTAEFAKIFGPRLATAPHPGLLKYPADLVVPGHGSGVMVVDDLHHTDLHAVGDVGYIQFFYRNAAGDKGGQPPAIYFRADDKFVPLKSTNDLRQRLEWDRAKLTAFGKWLDEHLPGK